MNNFTVSSKELYSVANNEESNRKKVGERLREAREAAGMSRDYVANIDGVDVHRNTLKAWETGEREASIETIFVLAKVYQTDPIAIISGSSRANTDNAVVVDDEYERVPFYPAEVSAGHGSFTDGHRQPSHYLAFRKRWIAAKNFHLNRLFGLVVSGDSMEPTIHDGSAIIVDTERNKAMDGNIYVIRMSDRLWVKRTQWLPNGGLRLISDNKAYDNIDIFQSDLQHDDIEVIGQVVHAAYDLIK